MYKPRQRLLANALTPMSLGLQSWVMIPSHIIPRGGLLKAIVNSPIPGMMPSGTLQMPAAGIKPEAFKIIDGKLYLSWGKENKFFKNPEKFIQKADQKWSRALMKLDTQ
jgi:hypothetical protein